MANSSSYLYESEWGAYAFPAQKARLTTDEEMKAKSFFVNFADKESFKHAGIPIISDGTKAHVLDSDQMTLVYGATGSGKTRSVVVPLICTLAKAGENMIIFDQKGDFSTGCFSNYVRGTLDREGYTTRIVDFKSLAGDQMNILGGIYRSYMKGHVEEAYQQLDDIASMLCKNYDNNSKDNEYWTNLGKKYLVAVVKLLLKMKLPPEKFNFQSINSFCNDLAAEKLGALLDYLPTTQEQKNDMAAVACLHPGGRASGVSTAAEMISDFCRNNKLLNMCSHDTFQVSELFSPKTAIIICVPDARSTYDKIASIMLTNIITELVEFAAKARNNKLPVRVNVVADEFANYYVPDFQKRISTDRSKNIRYYLFLQGQNQLRKAYPDAAETIIANCTNVLYLSSNEIDLMNDLSCLSGVRNDNLHRENVPLVSINDLQGLKVQEDGRECYFMDRTSRYFAKLPDISAYTYCEGPKKLYSVFNPLIRTNTIGVYSFGDFTYEIKRINYSSQKEIDEILARVEINR